MLNNSASYHGLSGLGSGHYHNIQGAKNGGGLEDTPTASGGYQGAKFFNNTQPLNHPAIFHSSQGSHSSNNHVGGEHYHNYENRRGSITNSAAAAELQHLLAHGGNHRGSSNNLMQAAIQPAPQTVGLSTKNL